MKKFILGFSLLMGTAFISANAQTDGDACRYNVQLQNSGTFNGSNFEWVWVVTNPCPGNGKTDETLQDLSHWSVVPPACLTQADVVSAAYSKDGINWVALSATIAVDPSQSTYTEPVIKFNKGLNGAEPIYFKLVVNKVFYVGDQNAVFKSGKFTGTYTNFIQGMTCPPSEPGPR